MATLWSCALFFLLFTPIAILAQSDTYCMTTSLLDPGPGGDPLAAKLVKARESVLLLEAGDGTGSNLDEEIAGWFFLTWGDPSLSWNFFVKYDSDDNITRQ
jgi:hypothetical protein